MEQKRLLQLVLFICMLLISEKLVDASHFRGGVIYWRTISPINSTTGVTLEITQRHGWRRSNSFCDDTTITDQGWIGDTDTVDCRVGCENIANLGSVLVRCTDFSVSDDWSVGENTYTLDIPYVPVLEASFSSCCWLSTLVVGSDASWELTMKFNMNTTLTKRTGNASPKTKMSPVVNLLHGCNHTITIPVEDADGDDVRCRWSNSAMGECGGVCSAFPGAVLNERDCTIFYSATGNVGLYAVAVQIEDFYSRLDSVPFSSVPLQFLVNIFTSSFDNVTCYSTPTFAWPTRRDGVCVGIPPNATYQEAIIAQSGGSGVTIVDITTQSPIGLRKSALARGPASNNWYMNLTWTPTDDQTGNNIFCFSAVDSTGANSKQNCITFAVGSYPPVVIDGTQSPNGTVLPDNSRWQLVFDRPFARPLKSSYIRFYAASGTQLFTVDTATNPDVKFPDSSNSFTLSFQTRYLFVEKNIYYITIDNGIAVGLDSCGPESVAVYDVQWWRITIKDITPPVLTFLVHPDYSDGNVFIVWSYDEPAQSVCVIQSPGSSYKAACNDSLFLSSLAEGYYTLFVQASDVVGNSKQYQVGWYVDLTPPVTTISSNPPPLSNSDTAVFTVYCSDLSSCLLRCAVHDAGAQPVFQNCTTTFTTQRLSDGAHTFSAFATDIVGNVGPTTTYTWTIDRTAPTISTLVNISIPCGSPYDPSTTGIPTAADNIDTNPTVTYADVPGSGCQTLRTWTVRDQAGNTVTGLQVIAFTNLIGPSVSGTPDLYVACGETNLLTSSSYVTRVLNISSPCGRKINITYTDSSPAVECGISITRQWVITDDCNSGVTYFSQTIHILSPTDPDYPINGQENVYLLQSLGWPAYPGSLGYNIYIWQFGTQQPLASTAFRQSWYRYYFPTNPYPPNTQILWKIGFIISSGNGTREIPGPTWGFTTESFADLTLKSIVVPPTAFSGSSFLVTWTVTNKGNVSTSLSTNIFYDAIYLSRSSNFADAYLAKTVYQERYLDPEDGYTSSASVTLQPADIGKFYIFVTADVNRNVRENAYGGSGDYSNNRLIASQAVQVQLTPPPNLKVASMGSIGIAFSGAKFTVRFVIENAGIGITAAASWTDGLYLSADDQKNASDPLLLTVGHTGALASGSQYVESVGVDIPNAIEGDFYILLKTDLYDNVFENTDEDDNWFAMLIKIILSPYPDLIVVNVTVANTVYTGDVITIAVIIQNAGLGSPFEYSWTDYLTITPVTDNTIVYYSAQRAYFGGQQLSSRSTYRAEFVYQIPPTLPTGSYNISVTADAFNQVFENKLNGNNAGSTVVSVVQQLPDLLVNVNSVATVENVTGNYLAYSITIQNSGVGKLQIQSWENALIASSSAGRIKTIFSFLLYPSLFENGTILLSNQSVYLPILFYDNVTILFEIDVRNQIVETNRMNNYVQIASFFVTKRRPDISVRNITAPSSSRAGSIVLVTWVVENVGNIAVGDWLSWYDEITLSFGASYSVAVGRVYISLQGYFLPGQNYERQVNVTIPSNLAGVYELVVTTAQYTRIGEGQDSNDSNNQLEKSISITTPPSPEFKLRSCSYEVQSRSASLRTLTATCSLTNIGNSMEVAVNWTDRISVINSTDGNALLTAYVTAVRKLGSGESYSISTTFVIPPGIIGYFQLEVTPDISHNLPTQRASPSFKAPKSVTIPAGPSPVLTITSSQLSQGRYLSGTSFTVNCTITNTGEAALPLTTWTDALFLFPQADASKLQVTSSGFLINSLIQNTRLAINSSYYVTFKGTLPYFLNGRVYVYIVTDLNSRLPVLDNRNPFYYNMSITIEPGPLPDLSVTIAAETNTTLYSGQILDLNFTVSNTGNSTAVGVWYDSVYLSQDRTVDPFDLTLRTVVRLRELERGANYTQTASLSIPYDLRYTTYYIIVVSNVRRSCVELTYDNNADFKYVDVQVLPASDLVVQDVRISKTNVTYFEDVTFDWTVANNGSVAINNGRKCDSVYLSTDDKWDIDDITVTEPGCGWFSYLPKGSSNYQARAQIPAIPKGQFKAIVRTRSNLKDFNLANNIGVSVANITAAPPFINLNENKTLNLTTNSYLTFELTGIPPGIGLVVVLGTNYKLAYHSLYIRRNAPPATNKYDVASKQLETTQQRVSVSYTKPGTYYLQIQSTSSVELYQYPVYIVVKEAKFEITSIYPTVLAKDSVVTLRISGSLLSRNMEIYLRSNLSSVAAINVYRYIPEVAYATFNTSLPVGFYTVTLNGYGGNAQVVDAVRVSDMALPGKLRLDVLTPRAVRAGNRATVQIKVTNTGYSDIQTPMLLLWTSGNSKVVPADADSSRLPSSKLAFFPLDRNRPPSMLPPNSVTTISFIAIPNNPFFSGIEDMNVKVIDDTEFTYMITQIESDLKPYGTPEDIWKLVWNNILHCLGDKPTSILNTIDGHFTQHYSSLYTVSDLLVHLRRLVDGSIPGGGIVKSADVFDQLNIGLIPLMVARVYDEQLYWRKSFGPFGKGWTSPQLEISVEVFPDFIRLTRQRKQYKFTSENTYSSVFHCSHLPNDKIVVNNNNELQYTSGNVLYNFDIHSGLLISYADTLGRDTVNVSYSGSLPVSFHHSNGSSLYVEYNSDSLISSMQLSLSGINMSKVFYYYNTERCLTRVADGRDTVNYEYSSAGDLVSIMFNDMQQTLITYDDAMHLMDSSSDYINGHLVQKVLMQRFCDGHVQYTVMPVNASSMLLYGENGILLEQVPAFGQPVSYTRDDTTVSKVDVLTGDEIKLSITYENKTKTFTTTNANGDTTYVQRRDDGLIDSIGDSQGPYYKGEYQNGSLTQITYRDGTFTKFEYNNNDQRTSYTLRDGSTIKYNYDAKNFVRDIQTENGRYGFVYDQNGMLVEITDPNQQKTGLKYNSDNQPISVLFPDGTQLTYTYNECNERASVVSNTGYNCTYTYDELCRISQVIDGAGFMIASFEYGSDSTLVRKRLGNGIFTEYSYEPGTLHLSEINNFSPRNESLSYYKYTYDEWGNRIKAETHEGTWSYKYDALGQLTQWISPTKYAEQETLEYDSALNRKSKETAGSTKYYSTNSMYQHTDFNKMQNFTYDKNGNLVVKQTQLKQTVEAEEYTYSQEGHVTRIRGKTICDYEYNVFGSVSRKTCTDGTDIRYTVDPFGFFGADILIESTASGSRFIYNALENGLLSTAAASNPNQGTFFLFDGDGSAVQTADINGGVKSTYSYDPFGRKLVRSNTDENLFQFLAFFGVQIVNETSNIVLMRNRLYDAEHGRFLSPDPLGIAGSASNPYIYALNNPVTYKDPKGEIPIFLAPLIPILRKAGVGAVKGIGEAAVGMIFDAYVCGKEPTFEEAWKTLAKGAISGAIEEFIPPGVGTDPRKLKKAAILAEAGITFATNFIADFVFSHSWKDAAESGAKAAIGKIVEKTTGSKNAGRVASSIWCDPPEPPEIPPPRDPKPDSGGKIPWVASRDPNEIEGPLGYGDNHYISGIDPLDYKIEFENHPNATAPAQRVTINCHVDENLNLGTLRIGIFAFGDYRVDSGYSSSHLWSKFLDATDTLGVVVHMFISIDYGSNDVNFFFIALDPLTLIPPEDPLVGFLPPNNGTTGQGYVTFRINSKNSAATSTNITEKASIIFDENAPIDTSSIFNTIDRTPPTVTANVSTVSGGVLVQFQNTDEGSGVKSVDLYTLKNGSANVLRRGIDQPGVVINLQANVEHVIVPVAIDNVDNEGDFELAKQANALTIYVAAECPGNCSGKGECTTSGLCVCDSGYGGDNCSEDVISFCEPPIVDLSYSNVTTDNTSITIYLSARTVLSQSNETLSMLVSCSPNTTTLNKGVSLNDGIHLSQADFGNVELMPPQYFAGFLTCNIEVTLVDSCGVTNRTAQLSLYVMSAVQETTLFSLATTAETVQTTGAVSVSDVGVTVSTASVVDRTVTSVNGTLQPVVVVTGITTNIGSNITNLVEASGSTATNIFGSRTSVQPVDGITVSTVKQTGQVTGDSPGSSGSSIRQTAVTATVGTGTSTGSITPTWTEWSGWTQCSRSCDTGVQVRRRTCQPATAVCSGDSTQQIQCSLRICPAQPDETTQGTLLDLLPEDMLRLLVKLDQLLRLVTDVVNTFCIGSPAKCCNSIFGSFTSGLQNISNLTSLDLVSLASGYPVTPEKDLSILKVIVKVNKVAVSSQCVAVSRSKRQADLVIMDKTIVTEALKQNQNKLQIELNVTILDIQSAPDISTNTTSNKPMANTNIEGIVIGVVIGVVGLVASPLAVYYIVRKYRRGMKKSTKATNINSDTYRQQGQSLYNPSFYQDKYARGVPRYTSAIQVRSPPPLSSAAMFHVAPVAAAYCHGPQCGVMPRPTVYNNNAFQHDAETYSPPYYHRIFTTDR